MGLGRITDLSKWKPSKGNHESVFGRQDLQPAEQPPAESITVCWTLAKVALGKVELLELKDGK